MTNDIVTRLREVCMCKGITCPHDGINEDAADEIERLREELQASQDTTRAWIQMLGKLGNADD